MSRARVGYFGDKGFVEFASGSRDYCEGFSDGFDWNDTSMPELVVLMGDQCRCGPDRDEYISPETRDQHERRGCKRCDVWDAPPRFK